MPLLRRKWTPHATRDELQAQADAGNSRAQVILGWAFFNGSFGPPNYFEAGKWLQLAAESGEIDAYYGLSYVKMAEGNSEKSFEYMKKCADLGCLRGVFWTGIKYMKGEGVSKSTFGAMQYFKEAEGRGHLVAKRMRLLQELESEENSYRAIKIALSILILNLKIELIKAINRYDERVG